MKHLGKKPPTQNGSSENEQHFHDALLEAADELENDSCDDSCKSCNVKLAKKLRISAGEKK